MPSFAKLDIVAGKMVSSWNSPRPLGTSVRAVITLVPIPIRMTVICAAKMPRESRANWPSLLIWGPSSARRASRGSALPMPPDPVGQAWRLSAPALLAMAPPPGRGQRRRPHLDSECVEGVAALAHEGRIALLGEETSPQAGGRGPAGVA